MDNNQNNMFSSQPEQPQQPQPQASPFEQQPQQQTNSFGQQPQANPFGQQPQQQANPFGQQQQQGGSPFGNQFAPKQPMNVSLGLIAMICSAVSLVMAVIGSIFACTDFTRWPEAAALLFRKELTKR